MKCDVKSSRKCKEPRVAEQSKRMLKGREVTLAGGNSFVAIHGPSFMRLETPEAFFSLAHI